MLLKIGARRVNGLLQATMPQGRAGGRGGRLTRLPVIADPIVSYRRIVFTIVYLPPASTYSLGTPQGKSVRGGRGVRGVRGGKKRKAGKGGERTGDEGWGDGPLTRR